MPLTITEHYAASAVCFVGGILSVVTQLWLLFDFFPKIHITRGLRPLHIQLTLANMFVVLFFFISATTHFEQRWPFGDVICNFYVFWCKFAPTAAVSLLAVCLYAEYQCASHPKKADSLSFSALTVLGWLNGLLWGTLALTWARYGQEPAAYTCTVVWYEVQPYVTVMSICGFALPASVAAFYAFKLWYGGLLNQNPLAKSAVGLLFTMVIQLSGYGVGYLLVCCGWKLSLYTIAFASVWTKVMGISHPFVYSNMFAAANMKPASKRE